MENQKLGILLLAFSLIFGSFLIYFNNTLNTSFEANGCILDEGCMQLDNTISITHIGFGFFGFMLGLGFYILFFNKTEENIMRRLEEEKNNQISKKKFETILLALDPYEKKALQAIRDQEGITQTTLRIRTDMSKSKLSYVLGELERRNLIKKVAQGKTFSLHLRI